MSQRTFSFLILLALSVVVSVFAISRGVFPSFDNLPGQLLTLVTPAILVFTTLIKWYDTLDAKVAAGEIKPGDIVALFSMSDFWITEVACLAGVGQVVGLQLMNEQTQAVIVNFLLLGATVLLRSFTNRPPTSQVVIGKATVVSSKASVEVLEKAA